MKDKPCRVRLCNVWDLQNLLVNLNFVSGRKCKAFFLRCCSFLKKKKKAMSDGFEGRDGDVVFVGGRCKGRGAEKNKVGLKPDSTGSRLELVMEKW